MGLWSVTVGDQALVLNQVRGAGVIGSTDSHLNTPDHEGVTKVCCHSLVHWVLAPCALTAENSTQ